MRLTERERERERREDTRGIWSGWDRLRKLRKKARTGKFPYNIKAMFLRNSSGPLSTGTSLPGCVLACVIRHTLRHTGALESTTPSSAERYSIAGSTPAMRSFALPLPHLLVSL